VSTPNGIASSLQTEGAQDVVDVERDVEYEAFQNIKKSEWFFKNHLGGPHFPSPCLILSLNIYIYIYLKFIDLHFMTRLIFIKLF
jgi:hypothetical protein